VSIAVACQIAKERQFKRLHIRAANRDSPRAGAVIGESGLDFRRTVIRKALVMLR